MIALVVMLAYMVSVCHRLQVHMSSMVSMVKARQPHLADLCNLKSCLSDLWAVSAREWTIEVELSWMIG